MIVGVSGGPDSVCLLDVLASLQEKYAWDIRVAHVNYKLREEDSDHDEAFVVSLAKKYGFPCDVLHPNVSSTQSNLEDALRAIRYDFFETLRQKHGFDTIVVAHTRDDQAETVLLRLLRGSGLLGLQAMRPRNGALIRPFLQSTRTDILAYLSQKNLSFCTDRTNTDESFTRNRIRHQLIPYLEDHFNPDIRTTLARTALSLADDYCLFQSLADDRLIPYAKHESSLSFSSSALQALDPALQRHFIRHITQNLVSKPSPLSFAHVEEIRKLTKSTKNKNQTLSLPRLKVLRKGDTVTVTLA